MEFIDDCGCTATGLQLANRLIRLVGGLLAGNVPACIGRPLAAAVDLVERKQTRHAALLGATTMLDPDGNLSLWQVSGRLADALERFQNAAYRRVRAGHRPPNELESHLIVLTEIPGPACQASLWRELVKLTERDQ